MGTRREDLAEALDAIEEKIPETLTPEPEVITPTVENISADPADPVDGERVRDESGRFSKKPEAPNPDAIVDVEAKPVEVQRAEAPKSWKAEQRANWDKLDPAVANYISQREQEMSRGVEQERERLAPAVQMYQSVEPFVSELRKHGANPEAIARDLFYTHRLLATGDEATKLQTIVGIAHSVGIPLHQMLTQGNVPQHFQQHLDPNVMAAQQRARDAQNQLEQRNFQDQNSIQQAALDEVNRFKETHPHVDELGPTMQRLLQAGEATDLDSAYSKALRLNDKLFEQSQASQREAAEKQRRIDADKAAKAAKANAVSTRSATPGTAANGVAPKGRRAALEDAFDSMSAGRI